MVEFSIKEIQGGNVLQGQKMTFVFPYTGELKYDKISKSCVCSTPIVDEKTKTIRVGYNAPMLGNHPATGKKIMSQETWKVITVYETDGTVQQLKFLTNIVRHI